MEGHQLWYLENIDMTGIFCPTKVEDAMQGHAKRILLKMITFICLINMQISCISSPKARSKLAALVIAAKKSPKRSWAKEKSLEKCRW